MVLADYPRGQNRARINNLFNGAPPYTDDEVQANGIAVNVNSLESTKLGHDARTQFYAAFLKPGNFFVARTDYGPKHKRKPWGDIVTKEINRRMKRSLPYMEKFRSVFALDVLHGIGPSSWDDRWKWCPRALGVEDVLVPSNTYLTMENLPFFAIRRSYTAEQLKKLTSGPKVDAGWNMPLVNRCIEWVDKECRSLMGSNWPEIWSPEKVAERVKGDGGFYSSDQVPTIDVFDFYFWNDEDKRAGWNRRMILDSWGTPSSSGSGVQISRRTNHVDNSKGEWLYNPGKRKYAEKLSELITWQFADLSAVGPFRYHSVRSLGFLLYAVCHLQNRLRCKFNEAVFEGLMMYLRVKSLDDAQRALKVELISRGFVDETVQFIPKAERWDPNVQLAELGLGENQRIITEHSSSYVQNQNFSRDRVEKTKFQVMAEVNAMTTLISAGLMQAYAYQVFEYREVVRRFFRSNSKDPEVRDFRAAVLRQRVPEEVLNVHCWDVEPERLMGAGNKTLEMAIAEQLMAFRPLYDPEAQRKILRDVTLAITDDPARAEDLVPEQPHISDSVHDTELAFGALMQGSTVTPKPGLNAVEVAGTMIKLMMARVQKIMQTNGMGTPDEVIGLNLCAQYAAAFISMLAQDPESKSIVKKLGDALSKIMNEVRAMQQRQQEAMQKAMEAQAQGNGQMDPKDQAKIQSMQMQAQVKADNQKQSHAQRTAQRQIQFEMEEKRAEQQHQLDMRRQQQEMAADLQAKDLEAAGNIRRTDAEAKADAAAREKTGGESE